MHIERFFTTSISHPFDGIVRTKRTVKIEGTSFYQENVEAPDFWSDRAVTIAASKYFVKKGLTAVEAETSVFDMVMGVAKAITNAGKKQGYFFTDADAQIFEDELAYMLIHQYGAFNSPVWFNVRKFALGMRGNGGQYHWNSQTQQVEITQNNYEFPQCSACFIQNIEDSLLGEGGILDFIRSEARLFKNGSGSGANHSKIREKGALLTAGGTASGLMSFLDFGDVSAKVIKSGGTTRRAAKMVSVDIDHPEIEDFIQWKMREEKKAQALIAAGFEGGLNGEAYRTVSGQNANNSVRIPDEFMQAVELDLPWKLTSRIDGKTVKEVSARKLWRDIAEAAWYCADPGIQFDTTINNWNPTPESGRINGSNPCSEYMSQDNSACNLSSLRLTKFFDQSNTFLANAFVHACEIFILAQDILVDYSSYPTEAIAKGAHEGRQLGLGYADLGSLLMRLGVAYDSTEGREIAATLTALMTGVAYKMSGRLAMNKGPGKNCEDNLDGVKRIIYKHAKYAQSVNAFELNPLITRIWDDVKAHADLGQIRNSQVTLLAPTGTIGFLMDCDTTGVEPLLGHIQYKTLAGGGAMTVLNQSLFETLNSLGYSSVERDLIIDHVLKTGGFSDAPGLQPRHLPIFDTAIPCGTQNRCLQPSAHYLMMAAVQPFLSGAISKTINLPKHTTIEEIEKIHLECWKLGLKAIAIYRDGCKEAQPVKVLKVNEQTNLQIDTILHPPTDPEFKSKQKKLPKKRRGTRWALKLDNHKIFISSGEYSNGTLGEIFVDTSKDGKTLGGLLRAFSKALSIGLQYGVPLDEYIETFSHVAFEPSGSVQNHETVKRADSFVDLIMRVIGVEYAGRTDLQHIQNTETYVKENDVSEKPLIKTVHSLTTDDPLCPNCGTLTQRNGSCHRCPQCGESLGCS
jgi:ribonucleoside-diphosphate reductase alpha chain